MERQPILRAENLADGNVEVRLRTLGNPVILAVLSYPDDREPLAPSMHLAPDHAAIGQEAPHELLVDDHYLQRRGIVAQIEIAPFQQRYLHRLEVARRYQVPVNLHILVWARNVALHLKRFPVSSAKSQGR